MKMRFDKDVLPLTLYIHTLEYISRSSYDKRCTVRFEAVEKEKIEMFLTGELPTKLPAIAEKSQFFQEIWECFQRGGIDDVDFLKKKDTYLAQVGNAELNLKLNSFSEAKSIERAENDWWEIRVEKIKLSSGEEEDACELAITGYEEIEGEFSFKIRAVDEKTEKNLYRLYLTYMENSSIEHKVGSIQAGTTFSEIRLFYVGAALCSCLVDGANNPTAYFDMGSENLYSRNALKRYCNANYVKPVATQILGDMKTAAQLSYNSVLQDAINIPNLDVIISHWHMDHISIANDMAVDFSNQGAGSPFANFWQTANFIVPQPIVAVGWALTQATCIYGAMAAAGNPNFRIFPYVNNNQYVQLGLGWGNNIRVFKCDRNDTGLFTPNPHDHGIFALVDLVSGNRSFLAGDCAYDTICANNPLDPVRTNGGAGYNNLVASHHGGKYTHTSGANKSQFIPAAAAAVSDVFYSANGVAYGHPNLSNVNDHSGIGWNGYYTHDLPGNQNYMYLIR